MAASYCHDEPAAVWVCACSPASSFCETCLLRHAQEPGAHTVSHHGPPGQYVCGMCRRATDHAISCRYPVCLCHHCAECFSVRSGNEDAKIDEVAEPELPAEGRQVGREEAALVERRIKVERFQAGEMRRNADDLEQLFGIIDINRENERLKSENQYLIERVQTLEMDKQYLIDQHKTLSSKIDNQVELQEKQSEQLHTAAIAMAVTIAKPILDVFQVTCDSEWLKTDIAENLFHLASLGITNVLNSAHMRIVARVSAMLLKLLGPCEEMAVFFNVILALLTKKSEQGVNLLKNIEGVYDWAKGDDALREVLKGVMKLIGTTECEDSMSISARFGNVLSLKARCEFTIAISEYYGRREQDMDAWKVALSKVPLDWTDQEFAKQCLENLMKAIVRGDFSKEHLVLLNLMQFYGPGDERTMLAFTERAGELLNNVPLKQWLTPYLQEAIAQIEFAREMAPAEGQELWPLVLTTTKLIGEHATAEEIQRLMWLLPELNPRCRHSKSLAVFVRLLSRFNSEEKLRIFGFGALEWLFSNAKIRDNVSFADFIFRQIKNVGDFEENAESIGILLRDLTISEFPQGIEDCFRNLLGHGTRIPLATQLCIFFNAQKRETERLILAWKELLNASGDKRKMIDSAIALLQTRQEESLLISLRAFEKMAPLRLPLAATLIQEVYSVLRDIVSEREQLTTLLRTVEGVLRVANPPSSLAIKCLSVWKDGRARGSKQIYAFCQFVLQKIGTPNIYNMLDDVIATFAQATISAEVVFLLLKIYQADGNNPSILSRQLTALIKLRNVDALGPLLSNLKNRPMPSQHRTLLINSVLDMSTPGSVHATCSDTHTLINATGISPLLAVLCQLQEPGVVKDILRTAQQNPSAVDVIVRVASLFVELEGKGELKDPLLHQTSGTRILLQTMLKLLQNRKNGMIDLCLKIIEKVPLGEIAMLTLICNLARDLVDSVGIDAVNVLRDVLLSAKDKSKTIIEQNLQRKFAEIKDRLIALRNRTRDRVLFQDVYTLVLLVHVHTKTKELVNVQPKTIRFFDFDSTQWGQPVQLRKQIQFNSEYSSHTILDDETIFCCGGNSQAWSNGSMAAAAYILSRDGTVTDLPPMNVARGGHGIIFIDGIRTVYVFGCCKR